MQEAKPILLIRPMNMSDFFPSQPGAGSAEARTAEAMTAEKAVRKSLRGRRRRLCDLAGRGDPLRRVGAGRRVLWPGRLESSCSGSIPIQLGRQRRCESEVGCPRQT